MQNILSLCTKSNAGKRRAIQHLTSDGANDDGAETREQLGSFLLSQLQNWTIPRRRTGHFKHYTKRYRKHQKGNMPHLQSQWATDHHRSQRKDHRLLRSHFQPEQSTYQPFTKPNTTLKYVHRERNHPPTTTKNIPAGINERL